MTKADCREILESARIWSRSILCIFYCQTTHILKSLGQFENLVFVIMSTRENIRLIARTASLYLLHKIGPIHFLVLIAGVIYCFENQLGSRNKSTIVTGVDDDPPLAFGHGLKQALVNNAYCRMPCRSMSRLYTCV